MAAAFRATFLPRSELLNQDCIPVEYHSTWFAPVNSIRRRAHLIDASLPLSTLQNCTVLYSVGTTY